MFFKSYKKVMLLVLFVNSAWVFYINGLNCFPTAKLNAWLESLTLFLMQNSLVFTDVRIQEGERDFVTLEKKILDNIHK